MTRINVVPVDELCDQHLFAEWREMTRVRSLVDKTRAFPRKMVFGKIPEQYVLGTGHVYFFYDKFKFLFKRHRELTKELLARGYRINPDVSFAFLIKDDELFNDYKPTKEALKLNRDRIKAKTPKNPRFTKPDYSVLKTKFILTGMKEKDNV